MWTQQSNTQSNNLIRSNQVQEQSCQNQDQLSYYNQVQYSNTEQFTQQQKEFTKPQQNMQQIPYFIAIPFGQSSNQQNSILPPLLNDDQQSRNLESSIVKSSSSSNEVLLKDLNFTKKSQHVLQSLLLIVVQQICIFFGIIQVFWYLDQSITDKSPYFLLLFVPLHLALLFLSNLKHFKWFPFSLLLYLMNIVIIPLIMFYFCTLFSRESKDEFSFSDFGSASICCLLIIPINIIEIGIIMIYLCIEKQEIQFKIMLLILGVIHFIPIIMQIYLCFILVPPLIYAILLLNAINQSFEGRFNIKQGQILSATNSFNYGIVFPFKICG